MGLRDNKLRQLAYGKPHAEQDRARAQDDHAGNQQRIAETRVANGNAKADGEQSQHAYADACGEQHVHVKNPTPRPRRQRHSSDLVQAQTRSHPTPHYRHNVRSAKPDFSKHLTPWTFWLADRLNFSGPKAPVGSWGTRKPANSDARCEDVADVDERQFEPGPKPTCCATMRAREVVALVAHRNFLQAEGMGVALAWPRPAHGRCASSR